MVTWGYLAPGPGLRLGGEDDALWLFTGRALGGRCRRIGRGRCPGQARHDAAHGGNRQRRQFADGVNPFEWETRDELQHRKRCFDTNLVQVEDFSDRGRFEKLPSIELM